jgi:integrase
VAITRPHERIKRARRLKETTIRKRCACARQFFEQAVRLNLVRSNPFKSKRIPTSLPKAKQKAFISAEAGQAIIHQLPDAEWKLLFSLARWGGMRIPSEPTRLKWSDIDWERGRVVIHSPKTEHHEGHETRIIPLFPELKPLLSEMRSRAPKNQVYVLPMLQRVTGTALRKPVIKAIEAAGFEVWEKLFVSLRATRDTELRERFPVHVVEAWLGHEDRVAKRNYTQVTEEHFGLGAETTELANPKNGA